MYIAISIREFKHVFVRFMIHLDWNLLAIKRRVCVCVCVCVLVSNN